MRMRGLVPLLVLATAGCVSTNAAVLNPSVKLAPICPDGVQLFTSADKVGKDYREIALLNSSGQSGSTSEKGMYDSQRKKPPSLAPTASSSTTSMSRRRAPRLSEHSLGPVRSEKVRRSRSIFQGIVRGCAGRVR